MTTKTIYANVGPFGTEDEVVHTRYEIKHQAADEIREYRAKIKDESKFDEIFTRLDELRESTEQIKRAVDYLVKRQHARVYGVRRDAR